MNEDLASAVLVQPFIGSALSKDTRHLIISISAACIVGLGRKVISSAHRTRKIIQYIREGGRILDIFILEDGADMLPRKLYDQIRINFAQA
jgi:hypothetical protein